LYAFGNSSGIKQNSDPDDEINDSVADDKTSRFEIIFMIAAISIILFLKRINFSSYYLQ